MVGTTSVEMVEIPRAEYERFKVFEELEEIDLDFVKKVVLALKNFRTGKFREWN